MVVLRTQSEFGCAPPPQTPYSIISNLPGWSTSKAVRDGDKGPMVKLVHIYPRFAPTHYVAQLGQEVAKKVGLEGKGCMVYLNPAEWPYTRRHVAHEGRGEHRIRPDDVMLRCVDVAGHRVYAVLFEPQHAPAMMLTWGAPGLGISIRGGEELLRGVDSMVEVPVTGTGANAETVPGADAAAIAALPAPTWTPESPAHAGIRQRITELLHRAPRDAAKVASTPGDVFLYPTGMAALFHTSNLLLAHRPGCIVALGIIFHNTYHHLVEESPHGWRYFGRVDGQGLDEFEAWLDEGQEVSYVFVEVPGNPSLDTPDLARLKALSEKHRFVFIVDETVSGFANVDVLALSDIVTSSLTKSFSGYANVLGGSVVLNPQSPRYAELAALYRQSHRNELFAADAQVLLDNSRDLLARSAVLNRNARAMADFLAAEARRPGSPVAAVRYPSLLPTRPAYDALLRRPAPELPGPGYGCLLNVDFVDLPAAVAFYDRCGFYPSPHLGGHVSLIFAYNMFVYGKKPEEREYMRSLGVKEESVRISAGLEDVEDLIDTLRDALEAAMATRT